MPGKNFIFQILLFFVTLLAFYPALNGEFLNFDDHLMVLNNRHIKQITPDSIWDLFTSWKIGLTYQPLTHLLYAFVYCSFGPAPFWFHLVNLLIHILNVILFFYIAIAVGITAEAAFGVALIFGIHPMKVDSVAWITELKGILFSSFYLAALLSHFQIDASRETKVSGRTFILYLLALLAKPMAVSFPIAIAAYDAFYRKESTWTNIKNKLHLLIPAILITYLTLLAHAPGEVHSIQLSIQNRFLVPIFSLGYLIVKVIFPFNMALLLDYPTFVKNLLVPENTPYFLMGIIFPLFLFHQTRRWNLNTGSSSPDQEGSGKKPLIFGLWFFMLTVLPMLQLIPFGVAITAVRYVYLPSIGLLLMLGWLADRLTEKTAGKKIMGVLILISIPTIFGMTRIRCQYWHDSISFWSRAIDEFPAFDACLGRGQAFLQMGEFSKAIGDFTKALEIDPKDVEARTDRARAYLESGNSPEAKADLEKVISAKPAISKPYFTLGLLLLRDGEFEASLVPFDKAIELSPQNADSYLNRGVALKNRGEFKKAIEDFSRAHKLFGDHPFIFINLAQTYKAMGDIVEARKNAEKAKQMGSPLPDDF